MSKMQCIVVTPENTLRDAGADFVAVPLFDGELGVDKNHSPMLGRLGNGEMRITVDGHVERFYVEGRVRRSQRQRRLAAHPKGQCPPNRSTSPRPWSSSMPPETARQTHRN